MNWLFWKNDKQNALAYTMSQLTGQLLAINANIAEVSERSADSLQQQQELNGQLAKLMRMQYKSGHETQVKLEQLQQEVTKMQQWQTKYDSETENGDTLRRQQEHLLTVLFCQLDELDTARSGLNDKENISWQSLLSQWAQKIVASLAQIGIYELDIMGKTFEPQIAEGVGTIPRMPGTDANIPYEVAEIVSRGFVNSEGYLLRKARVITYMEVSKP
ncbi:MAG TPA: nucleotide exchange factor GrpE [Negativicutes bacterium]|jgi:hypothetical protein